MHTSDSKQNAVYDLTSTAMSGQNSRDLEANHGSTIQTADTQQSEELFVIIDESGEGWGFDLDPSTMAKPMALASGCLFGFGMLAGIPAGLALGRSEESSGRKSIKPTGGGVWFALRAFTYGTILCGAIGVTATYATTYYYDAWTWKDFGDVMRTVIPTKRLKLEQNISPLLASVRSGASIGMAGPKSRAQEWLIHSRVGEYIRGRIEQTSIPPDNDAEISQPSGNDDTRTSNIAS